MKEARGAVTFGVRYSLASTTSPVKSFIIGFMNRSRTAPPSDASMNDDTFSVAFYPRKVQQNWNFLLDVVFPEYISATEAYVAFLYDEKILADDASIFENIVSIHNM